MSSPEAKPSETDPANTQPTAGCFLPKNVTNKLLPPQKGEKENVDDEINSKILTNSAQKSTHLITSKPQNSFRLSSATSEYSTSDIYVGKLHTETTENCVTGHLQDIGVPKAQILNVYKLSSSSSKYGSFRIKVSSDVAASVMFLSENWPTDVETRPFEPTKRSPLNPRTRMPRKPRRTYEGRKYNLY